jgi:hypothetical protein
MANRLFSWVNSRADCIPNLNFEEEDDYKEKINEGMELNKNDNKK